MKETLCWICRVPGTGGCSWDRSLQPVEGWDAKPTKLRLWTGYYVDTFCVKSCPLYQPDGQQGRDKDNRGMATPLSDEALERYIFAGFTDREISRRTGLALCTVKKRRQKFWRKRKEQENERKDG